MCTPVVESLENINNRYPRPSEIKLNLAGAVIGGFGKSEVEIEAGRLVQFFHFGMFDRWTTFRISELVTFYKQKGWNHNLVLMGLTGAWIDSSAGIFSFVYETETFIIGVLNSDGKMCVTEEFIKRCSSR